MQQFFQDLQGKIWGWLVQAFEKAPAFSNDIWNYAKPYLETALDWLEKTLAYLLTYLSYVLSLLNDNFIWLIARSTEIKPAFEKMYDRNRYVAIIILVIILSLIAFWVYMAIHVKRYEIFHKKSWMAVVVLLGPIGALIYYFFRKRKLEKEQNRQDKVMMKFFSPMHSKEEK